MYVLGVCNKLYSYTYTLLNKFSNYLKILIETCYRINWPFVYPTKEVLSTAAGQAGVYCISATKTDRPPYV